jgi:hypothetical protein
MAFCKWLIAKEGKTCRLPTEAEWEYACRAGTKTLFWSGDALPKDDVNSWGLKNMHSGPAEWCYDWHGEYPATEQTDPVGYDVGWAKVVRDGAVRAVTVKNADGSESIGPDPALVCLATIKKYFVNICIETCAAPAQCHIVMRANSFPLPCGLSGTGKSSMPSAVLFFEFKPTSRSYEC